MGVVVNRAPPCARYHRDAYLLNPHDFLCWRRLYPPEHAVRYGLLSWLQTCGFSPTWAGRVWILSARPSLSHRAKPVSPSVLLWPLLTRRASLSALKVTGAGASGAACSARSSGGASICVRGRAALSIKGGGNNGGLGLFHLQPVTLYLVTDPGT